MSVHLYLAMCECVCVSKQVELKKTRAFIPFGIMNHMRQLAKR